MASQDLSPVQHYEVAVRIYDLRQLGDSGISALFVCFVVTFTLQIASTVAVDKPVQSWAVGKTSSRSGGSYCYVVFRNWEDW